MDKLCLFCRSFCFDSGYPDLSDVTPGWDATMFCSKRKWEVKMYQGENETDLRKKLLTAQTCPLFELVEMPWLEKPIRFK